MPIFREGTDDQAFWEACYTNDEYQVPVFKAEDAVIDLGSNIGAFSRRAWDQGSRNIWAYEACSDNFNIGEKNARFPGVWMFNTAVVGTGLAKRMLFPNGNNSFFIPEHALVEVDAIELDSIIAGIGGRIRFLKIDIEGSEWEVLYTSKLLGQVDEIKGEYHEPCRTWWHLRPQVGLPPYHHLSLKAFLEGQGFQVEVMPPAGGIEPVPLPAPGLNVEEQRHHFDQYPSVVSGAFHAVRRNGFLTTDNTDGTDKK